MPANGWGTKPGACTWVSRTKASRWSRSAAVVVILERGVVDLAVAALPVGLAQLELLELARGGAREGVAQFDRRRALEVGEPFAAELDERGLVGLLAGAEHDERLHRLTPLLVGDADHGDLGDGRVLVEAVLDLDRRDVLAAGDDHVLLAVGDDDVGAVEVPAVAGVEPAVDDRLRRVLGLLPVALEHVVGAGQHL